MVLRVVGIFPVLPPVYIVQSLGQIPLAQSRSNRLGGDSYTRRGIWAEETRLKPRTECVVCQEQGQKDDGEKRSSHSAPFLVEYPFIEPLLVGQINDAMRRLLANIGE